MRRGNAVVIVALLVFLLLAMLLPLTFYLLYRSAAVAATAGLFGLPVLLIFLVIAILAAQKPHAAAVRKPAAEEHYSWERLFAPRKLKEVKLSRESVSRGFGEKAVIAVLLIVALVLLVVLSPAVTNIFGPDLSNMSNATGAGKNVSAAVQLPVITEEKEPSEGRNASGLLNLSNIGRLVKEGLLKVPKPAVKYAAFGLLALLFGGALAYSYRAGEFGRVAEWFAGWFAAVRENAVKLMILAAVVIVVAAAYAFRKKLHLSEIFGNAVSFIAAYKVYIIIGVVALLITIGILVMLERKGNNSK